MGRATCSATFSLLSSVATISMRPFRLRSLKSGHLRQAAQRSCPSPVRYLRGDSNSSHNKLPLKPFGFQLAGIATDGGNNFNFPAVWKLGERKDYKVFNGRIIVQIGDELLVTPP